MKTISIEISDSQHAVFAVFSKALRLPIEELVKILAIMQINVGVDEVDFRATLEEFVESVPRGNAEFSEDFAEWIPGLRAVERPITVHFTLSN